MYVSSSQTVVCRFGVCVALHPVVVHRVVSAIHWITGLNNYSSFCCISKV